MRPAIVLVALCALADPCAAADTPPGWSVAVEQGGRVLDASRPLRLQRAPFSLVFTGAPKLSYAILAASSCQDVEGLRTPEQIGEHVRPANIAAEGAVADNTFLVVNARADFTAGSTRAQAWSEDKDNDAHSFQALQPDAGGRVVATRQLQTFLLPSPGGLKSVPVAKYPGTGLCILATGLPPVGYMAHLAPRLLRIEFR